MHQATGQLLCAAIIYLCFFFLLFAVVHVPWQCPACHTFFHSNLPIRPKICPNVLTDLLPNRLQRDSLSLCSPNLKKGLCKLVNQTRIDSLIANVQLYFIETYL